MIFNFEKLNVLVIGDFMMDTYIYGNSFRNSPEAPVPVIIPERKFSFVGGAGNVAMNLRSLGANVSCLGCVGSDELGLEMIDTLESKDIQTSGLFQSKYKTISKTRIFSNDKQCLRIDIEEPFKDWRPPSEENFDYTEFDIIILSDYNKGVFDKTWLDIKKFNNIFIDPKKENFSFYQGGGIITPNISELKIASKKNILNDNDILDACNELISKHKFEYIIAKKGEKGMSVVGKNNFYRHIEPHFVENPDVTGAGDTVIAALSLSYFISKDIVKAAIFANAAASIAVSKKGTSLVELTEVEKLLL